MVAASQVVRVAGGVEGSVVHVTAALAITAVL